MKKVLVPTFLLSKKYPINFWQSLTDTVKHFGCLHYRLFDGAHFA